MTESVTVPATTPALFLTVRIGQSLHALPIEAIEEVLPALPIEEISSAPAFVRGVVYVRGHLIVILDGAARLGLPPRASTLEPQILCLKLGERLIGLEVDEALELVTLPMEHWLPVEKLGSEQNFLTAVTDFQGEIVRILDPERLVLALEEREMARISQ